MNNIKQMILSTVKKNLRDHCIVLEDMKSPIETREGVTLEAVSASWTLERAVIPNSIIEENLLVDKISKHVVNYYKDVSKIAFHSVHLQLSQPETPMDGLFVVRCGYVYD